MNLLYSAIVLDPGGLIAWLVVGVVAGWLAGKVMKGALLPTEWVKSVSEGLETPRFQGF